MWKCECVGKKKMSFVKFCGLPRSASIQVSIDANDYKPKS